MPKKIIIILLIATLVVLYLVQTIAKRSLSPDTSPLIPQVTPNYPETQQTDTESETEFIIDWSEARFENTQEQYPIYTTDTLINLDLAKKISLSMGFLSDQMQNLYGNFIWNTPDQTNILLYTPNEKAIHYQHTLPAINTAMINQRSAQDLAINTIQRLIPGQNFSIDSIVYETDSDYTDRIVTPQNADQIRININQTIDDLPVIPSTLIDPTMSYITVNRDQKIVNMTINDGYTDASRTNNSQTFSADSLKQVNPNNLINLTPHRLDHGEILRTSSTITLKVDRVNVAYINIKGTLSPVYLIYGNLTPNNRPTFPTQVKYIAPMR
jgi:hypothetical protein